MEWSKKERDDTERERNGDTHRERDSERDPPVVLFVQHQRMMLKREADRQTDGQRREREEKESHTEIERDSLHDV